MKKQFVYTVLPLNPNSKFIQSPWCGETYDTMKDARAHMKFFRTKFPEDAFEIVKEEPDWS